VRYYLRLSLFATVLLVPLTLLCILVLDEPVAVVVHNWQPLRSFFESLMWCVDSLSFVAHTPSSLGLPWLWLLLPGAFLVSWGLRWQHATIWLVVLTSMVGSEGLTNLLKMYFNRPHPEVLWLHTAPNASFWQPLGHYDAFPSGHTAWAAGWLLPLALRFPKLRWWLLTAVVLVGLGRVALEFHWLSDVLAAVYVSLVLTCSFELAMWWLRPRPRSQPLVDRAT
jgi:membrane-associated phospholipid phosphatase